MSIEQIKKIRNALKIGLSDAKALLLKYKTVENAINQWQVQQEELIKQEQHKKYIEFKDWFYIKDFFKDCSQEFFGDVTSLPNKIKPLTENYASTLWGQYISKKHRHAMLVKSDDDWSINNIISFVSEWSWGKSWNENDYGAFEKNVVHRLSWNPEDTIYFFWGKYTAVETSWETLYKYWIPFMYEDEMNIVMNLNSEEVLIIGVSGAIGIGKRNAST